MLRSLELLDELGPVDAQPIQDEPQHIQVPGVLAVGRGRAGICRVGHAAEALVAIAPGDLHPPLPHALGLAQLRQAHGRGDVGHVVLVARAR